MGCELLVAALKEQIVEKLLEMKKKVAAQLFVMQAAEDLCCALAVRPPCWIFL